MVVKDKIFMIPFFRRSSQRTVYFIQLVGIIMKWVEIIGEIRFSPFVAPSAWGALYIVSGPHGLTKRAQLRHGLSGTGY